MKIWGDKRFAQGYYNDGEYTYHIAVLCEGDIVVFVGTKNKNESR